MHCGSTVFQAHNQFSDRRIVSTLHSSRLPGHEGSVAVPLQIPGLISVALPPQGPVIAWPLLATTAPRGDEVCPEKTSSRVTEPEHKPGLHNSPRSSKQLAARLPK